MRAYLVHVLAKEWNRLGNSSTSMIQEQAMANAVCQECLSHCKLPAVRHTYVKDTVTLMRALTVLSKHNTDMLASPVWWC